MIASAQPCDNNVIIVSSDSFSHLSISVFATLQAASPHGVTSALLVPQHRILGSFAVCPCLTFAPALLPYLFICENLIQHTGSLSMCCIIN